MDSTDNSKGKIFFVVTIPAHLRVLMSVADLLKMKTRYEPVMIYYPSGVFDHNCENCQAATHRSFVWTMQGFLEKARYLLRNELLSPHERTKKKCTSRLLRCLRQNMDTFHQLLRKIKQLVKPLDSTGVIRQKYHRLKAQVTLIAVDPIRRGYHRAKTQVGLTIFFVLRVIGTTYQVLRSLVVALLRTSPFSADKRRTWLQRFLIGVFAEMWSILPAIRDESASLNFFQRAVQALKRGRNIRVAEQKFFYENLLCLIAQEKPSLVVLPEENLFYNSQFVIRAAHLHKIPVVVIPFTIVNTQEWAEAFFDECRFQANHWGNRIFAKAFPHWTLRHRGRCLILPPLYILGCEYFGMTPENPWLINSGASNVIAAENQFMTNYYHQAGIREEKIRLVGTLADDKLYAVRKAKMLHREALLAAHAMARKERIILIALPPNQFAAGKRSGCEFDTYDTLIRFIIETVVRMAQKEVAVLVNLHPRTPLDAVEWIEALGATIIPQPIEQLIPLADIYIAVASATIRMAMAVGVPVINYDAYQYDYGDYKNLSGVCEAKSRADYIIAVHNLMQDPDAYVQIKRSQEEIARTLFSIDGLAGTRLLNLLDELAVV